MKRLLLVDDEELVTSTLGPVLRGMRLNLEVLTARSASDALEQIRREPFDMVVTDHHMRDMKGVELLQRLRAEFPEARRVLLTGESQQGFRQSVDRGGALHGYIQKPYNLRSVQKLLRRLLDHPTPLESS